jgi:hypothetical protein
MKEQKTIHCVFHHGSRSKAPKADLGHQDIIFVYIHCQFCTVYNLEMGYDPENTSFPTSLLS